MAILAWVTPGESDKVRLSSPDKFLVLRLVQYAWLEGRHLLTRR